MRRTLFIILIFLTTSMLLNSCEENHLEYTEAGEIPGKLVGITELQVDHYKTVGFTEGIRLHFITKEGKELERGRWLINYSNIENFDYEWGYRYHLIAKKIAYEPPIMDLPAYWYEVAEIVSKTKVENEPFKIALKSNQCSGCSPILTGDKRGGFKLFDSVEIECGKFCDELSEINKIENNIAGIFEHSSGNRITLVDLESE